MKELSNLEKLVLEELQERSSKNPITRWQLKELTKSTDRNSRKIIENLRDKGIRVINNSTGYWIGSDKEYKEWVSHYTAYAYTILNRVRKMNQHTEGQLKIKENGEIQYG